MADQIANGESGLSVRTKLNTLLTQAETNANAADTALGYGKPISFASRAELVTWVASNTPINGREYRAGGLSYLGETGATAIADLPGLVPNGEVSPYHFGAMGDGVTDDTAAFQAAAAYAPDEIISGAHVYYITDKIVFNGTKLRGVGQRDSYFLVDGNFNLAATSIVQFLGNDQGGGLVGFGIAGTQPVSPLTLADLVQYPVAIDGAGVPRLYFDNVRLSGMIDGLDLTGNTGGLYIGRIELGCIGRSFHLNGNLDFSHVGSSHHWPFGFTEPDQLALYSASEAEALFINGAGADGLVWGKLSTFRAKVTIATDADKILPITFDTIQLDGDASRLVVSQGRVAIGQLYSTKSTAPTDPSINVSGGRVDIAQAQVSGGEVGRQILVTGGELRVAGGEIFQNRLDQIALECSAGVLDIKGTLLRWPSNARTQPFLIQSGTGQIVIDGCRPASQVAAEAVRLLTDRAGARVDGDSLLPHSVTLPPSIGNGKYYTQKQFNATITPATVGDWSVAYSQRLAVTRLDGDWLDFWLRLVFTPTFTTASGALSITGLPFTVINSSELAVGLFSGIALPAGHTAVVCRLGPAGVSILTSGPTASELTPAHLTSGTEVQLLLSGRARL